MTIITNERRERNDIHSYFQTQSYETKLLPQFSAVVEPH